MAENRLIIGSLPVMRGAYDNATRYYRDNQVTMYGSTFQSLADYNMGFPPAELREDGKVYQINTDKWIITANAIEAYNAGERIVALEETFSQEENPEFAYSVVDAEGRVLFGLTAEGRPYFPKNDTYRVESNAEWLAVWLDAAGHVLFGLRRDGSAYVAKSGFLDRLSKIEHLLKDSGISGEDLVAKIKDLQENIAPLSETFQFINNKEWSHAVTDSEGRLLFGIKSNNGEVIMPKQDTYRVERNAEWLAVWLDTAGHVLFGIRHDGTFYAAKHEFGGGDTDVEAEIAAINKILAQMDADLSMLQEAVSSLETGGEAMEMLQVTDDPDCRMEMTLDADGRVLSYRDKEGIRHENKGIDAPRLLIGGKVKDFVDRSELADEVTEAADNGAITLTQITGVSNHDTPNLLVAAEMQKTFSDGEHSFTPPNDGYEMSNRMECRAGDWFTRTGTATGMVVVTDENDKNGTRLFNADGTTLGSTFQVPSDMTWVRYIRMAADKAAALDGSVVICRGKEAYTGEQNGDFMTISKLRVEKRNLSKEVMYVASEDGKKYYELYVDAEGKLQVREVDPDVIPENELPENWLRINLTGDFGGYFDRFTILNPGFLFDMKAGGPVRIHSINPALADGYCNFEHFYTSSGEERYVVNTVQDVVPGGKGITIFDKDFRVIDTNIPGNDIHDFVYFSDDHLIRLGYLSANVDVPGAGMKHIPAGIAIWEMKKLNGKWTDVAHFYSTDYPALCTDAFGELADVTGSHPNTVGLDYDGNIILNMRNYDSWVKIRRVENEDGSVILGSATLDYDEAIIGRVGGRHNSGYMDNKRVLNEGFSFTDVPKSLTEVSDDEWEEWQWFHCHDVKYWGEKEIGGVKYPTYTLFDNNYWTDADNRESTNYNSMNKRNNSLINPEGDGRTYLSSKDGDEAYAAHTYSRVVQLSIDWENHRIKDYRIYYIPKKYSQEQCGATMYKEGIISIAYAYATEFGLWDFTTEDTEVSGHVYKGAKQLFLGKYEKNGGCYRANTYDLKE